MNFFFFFFVDTSVHRVKHSKLSAKMRGFLLALSATLASAASIARDALPAGAAIIPATNLEPRGSGKHGHKDKWGCNKPEYRHKVSTLR